MKGTADSIGDYKTVLETLKRPLKMKHYQELPTKFSHKRKHLSSISHDTTAGLYIIIA